jgi:uncharacterized membrane protein
MTTVSPQNYFSEAQQAAIMAAIAEAEKETSGEIRLHVENKCEGHVLDRAAHLFAELEMHKTKLRNGVLFYLAIADHRFAVIGDAGINAAVPANFWDDIKIKMQGKFRSGNFIDGLTEGILMAGNQLKERFPFSDADENELPDRISFGV